MGRWLRPLALALLLGAWPVSGHGAGATLPPAQQMPLILKVLTYNRALMQRPAPTLRLGMIYQPDLPESRALFEELQAEFEKVADRTVRKHRVELVPVPVERAPEWTPPATTLDVVYVAPVDRDLLPRITAWTRARKIVSVTGLENYVEEGVSFGVVARRNRTGVTINAPASIEEGSLWSEEFLGLCRVLDPSARGSARTAGQF